MQRSSEEGTESSLDSCTVMSEAEVGQISNEGQKTRWHGVIGSPGHLANECCLWFLFLAASALSYR